MTTIQTPHRVLGKNRTKKNQKKREKKWLMDVIEWANQPDNIWLNHFEAICEYDRLKVAKAIIKKVENKLKEYD